MASCASSCPPQGPDLCEIVITPNNSNWLIWMAIAVGIWYFTRDDGAAAHQKKKQNVFDSVI
jgi:hypothetical protein